MADYRNVPFKFINFGLNLAQVPENLEEGQFTRMLNVRVTTEGVLEGRQGTFPWVVETYDYSSSTYPYPDLWDIGSCDFVRHIGPIRRSGAQIPGYISVHSAASATDQTFTVFINGVPVVNSDVQTCPEATVSTQFDGVVFTGRSVVRATAKSGIDVVVLDGRYYVMLKDVDLTGDMPTRSGYNIGSTTTTIPYVQAFRLGIVRPSTAPVITTTTSVGTAGFTEAYYRVTYQNEDTEFESPPSGISNAFSAAIVTSARPIVNYYHSPDPQVTKIRIWRALESVVGSEYREVTSVDNIACASSSSWQDNISVATARNGERLWLDADEPHTSNDGDGETVTGLKMPYCWGPFLGKYIFWVGDPHRRDRIYWNHQGGDEAYEAVWGQIALVGGGEDERPDYNDVTDPGEVLVNGFIFGGNPFVFSRLNLYALDYGGPESQPEFVPRQIPLSKGLAAHWGYAVGPNAVFFVSRDGIYGTVCQGEEPASLTDTRIKPIFRGEDAGSLEAVDFSNEDAIRLNLVANDLHFHYQGDSGNTYHLVLDLTALRWVEWSPNLYHWAMGNEALDYKSAFLGRLTDQKIFQWDETFENSTESFSCQVRTASWDSGIPLTHKQFGVFMLDYQPDKSNAEVRVFFDSETATDASIGTLNTNSWNQTNRQVDSWDLQSHFAKSVSFDIQWDETPEKHMRFYQANLLFRSDQEQITHWSSDREVLDQAGWSHIKDSYWTMRSNGTVRLRVTGEGPGGQTVVFIKDLPGTNMEKKRFYVEHPAQLAKLWKVELDGIADTPGGLFPAEFRLYGDECMLFIKPWKVGAGYQPLMPFGNPGYAPYLRSEGGT